MLEDCQSAQNYLFGATTFLPIRDTKWLTLRICPNFLKQQEGGAQSLCEEAFCLLAHPSKQVKVDEEGK
ncbi:hypothetical protein Ciccas_012156, partial [Cichlidogyrus casuarinus]